MKIFKLYLLALVITLAWWIVIRVNRFYTFSVPTYLVFKNSTDRLFFQKDTLIKLTLSASGQQWLKKISHDTLRIVITDVNVEPLSRVDSLQIRFSTGFLQKKIDSLWGESFKITNTSDIILLNVPFSLRKQLPIFIDEPKYYRKDCFLCTKVNIDPPYVVVEGKPSLLAKLDSIAINIPSVFTSPCSFQSRFFSLPKLKDVKYHYPSSGIIKVQFPFCVYQHVQLERFYRFSWNNSTIEGKALIEAYIPPSFPLDSIELIAEFISDTHVKLKLKNQHIFKNVTISPSEIDLK